MHVFRLAELPPGGLTVDGPIDPGVLRDDRDRRIPVTGVRGTLRLRRGAGGFRLAGTVRGRVELECVRCLESFEIMLDSDIDLGLVERSDEPPPSHEQHVTAADASSLEVVEGTVDLGRVVREQLYLSLPLKPVCRPACRGLCSTCGADRNRIECGCSGARSDDRWAPLAELRRD